MEIKRLKEMQAEELKRRGNRKRSSIKRKERGRSADEINEDKCVGAEDRGVGAEDVLGDNPMETEDDLSQDEINLINFDI
jgi:hypothetical protein